jgi:hypothetical protein
MAPRPAPIVSNVRRAGPALVAADQLRRLDRRLRLIHRRFADTMGGLLGSGLIGIAKTKAKAPLGPVRPARAAWLKR